jgi:hypothetical protein
LKKIQNQSSLEFEFFISLFDEISPIKKRVGLGVHRQGVYLKSHLLCFKLLLSYKQCNAMKSFKNSGMMICVHVFSMCDFVSFHSVGCKR